MKKTIGFRFSEETHQQLKALAHVFGQTRTTVLERLVDREHERQAIVGPKSLAGAMSADEARRRVDHALEAAQAAARREAGMGEHDIPYRRITADEALERDRHPLGIPGSGLGRVDFTTESNADVLAQDAAQTSFVPSAPPVDRPGIKSATDTEAGMGEAEK